MRTLRIVVSGCKLWFPFKCLDPLRTEERVVLARLENFEAGAGIKRDLAELGLTFDFIKVDAHVGKTFSDQFGSTNHFIESDGRRNRIRRPGIKKLERHGIPRGIEESAGMMGAAFDIDLDGEDATGKGVELVVDQATRPGIDEGLDKQARLDLRVSPLFGGALIAKSEQLTEAAADLSFIHRTFAEKNIEARGGGGLDDAWIGQKAEVYFCGVIEGTQCGDHEARAEASKHLLFGRRLIDEQRHARIAVVKHAVGNLLAESRRILQIRKAAVDSEVVDEDVSLDRQRVADYDPCGLEQAFERVVRRSSAWSRIRMNTGRNESTGLPICIFFQIVKVGRHQLRMIFSVV